MANKPRRRDSAISRRKKLCKQSIGTYLYLDDLRIMDDEIAKRNKAGENVTRASLLRDNFHDSCVKKRLSPEEKEPIRTTLKKLTDELAAARAEIQTLTKTSKEMASAHEDSTALNQTEFKRIFDLSKANYNVTGQSFALVWACLILFQRFLAEPSLARTAEHQQIPKLKPPDLSTCCAPK